MHGFMKSFAETQTTQTTISVSSHSLSLAFSIGCHRNLFLSWLEIQSLTIPFGTASKITHNAKFISMSPDKVWKYLSWGNIEAHGAAMGLLEGLHYDWKDFTDTSCLASGLIIFQYITYDTQIALSKQLWKFAICTSSSLSTAHNIHSYTIRVIWAFYRAELAMTYLTTNIFL